MTYYLLNIFIEKIFTDYFLISSFKNFATSKGINTNFDIIKSFVLKIIFIFFVLKISYKNDDCINCISSIFFR